MRSRLREFEVAIVVIEFLKELVPRQFETPEIMLTLRIVIGAEGSNVATFRIAIARTSLGSSSTAAASIMRPSYGSSVFRNLSLRSRMRSRD
jgi:hypothetical protein